MHRVSNEAERWARRMTPPSRKKDRVSGTLALPTFTFPAISSILRACPIWFNGITPALNFSIFSPHFVTKNYHDHQISIENHKSAEISKGEWNSLSLSSQFKMKRAEKFEIRELFENSFRLLSEIEFPARLDARRCIFQKENSKGKFKSKRGDPKSGEPGQNYAARGATGTRDRRK